MSDESLKRFGEAVRKIRTSCSISQEALADKCNLHRTYISDIELGKRNVSLVNIDRIARALNIQLSDLFKEYENPHA